jgi:ribonucleoside-diphosphate reductase alpha chain
MADCYWLNDDSRTFLSRGYLQDGQTAEERIRVIAERAEEILGFDGFADRFEEYMLKGWISLSSPIWSNFGTERGLPISCNNSYIEDSIESILMKTAEIGAMTKHGAGTSAYLGDLRPRNSKISGGGTSNGPTHFAELIQTTISVISQSNVRRGSAAIYLPVEHADIEEFLECREEGNPIQHLSLGVTITDAWMESMLSGDKDKRRIWMRILRKRSETGYPYIFFTDTVNRAAPQAYKDKGRRILGSNLCSEIALSSNADESFVCNLSSLNLLHWDDWKDTDLVEIVTWFLDAVMTEYIQKTENIPLLRNAYNFAVRQRALGIGSLGWHSYLQSKMIPFDDAEAFELNVLIHKAMDERSLWASKYLVAAFGEPEMLKGYGVRNVTRLAIAPTTSSSFILGQVSPSIEPLDSNYFTKDLQKGKFTYRNPYLIALLRAHQKDDRETWESILLKGGSVQHLDFLSDRERAVFKTFGEIDQMAIIIQAADRQQHIDQTQSLNIKIHPDTPLRDLHTLMVEGWKLGVKTYYYQRSTNPAQEYVRELLSCAACEA